MKRIISFFVFWLCQLALMAQVGGANGEYDPQNPPNPGETFQVTFVTGNTVANTYEVASGTVITAGPVLPAVEGYTFSGWDPELPYTVYEDVTFEAQWSLNYHDVLYLDADGEEYDSFVVGYGENVPVPSDPSKQGYVFVGWTPEVPATMPDSDLVFTPVFREVISTDVTITFGSYPVNCWADMPASMTVAEGTEVSVGVTPRNNYRFVEWQIDGQSAGSDEVLTFTPAANCHVVAVFEYDPESPDNPVAPDVEEPEVYAVIYIVNDEEWARDSVACGDSIILRVYPLGEGEVFSGWFCDEEYETMPDHDVVYTATVSKQAVAVDALRTGQNHSNGLYSLQGVRRDKLLRPGIYVLRTADGRGKKIFNSQSSLFPAR